MRFLRLRTLLEELLELAKPAALFFEEVRSHAGTDAAHVFGGLIAVITELCESRNLPYQGIPVGTVTPVEDGRLLQGGRGFCFAQSPSPAVKQNKAGADGL